MPTPSRALPTILVSRTTLATLATLTAAALAAAAPACTDDPTAADPTNGADDLKGDRAGSLTFVELDPDLPLPAASRTKIFAALEVLHRLSIDGTSTRQRRLAGETLARIQAGDVLIGAIAAAHGDDLWHMCKDMEGQAACASDTPPADPAWSGDETLRAALADELAGYQWGNRLYFDFSAALEPTALATTLVHETTHALNRSECSYYADYFTHEVDDTLAWLEEYRAFVAECVIERGKNATASRCDAAAQRDLDEREYGFSPDLSRLLDDPAQGSIAVARSLFADDGAFGFFLPLADVWPDDFQPCETR